MALLKTTYENWVSTSTIPAEIDYNFKKTETEKPEMENEEREIDRKSVVNFINEYRKMFNKGVEVREIKYKAKEEFGEELYLLLELDSFFKTLRLKQKLNPNTADNYFDEYIYEIPRIFLKIEDDYSKYNLEDKFAKLKQIKAAKKEQKKISKRIFKKENKAIFIEFLKMSEWIKNTKQKVLITLDGRDSAGKGSFIRLIEENMPEKVVEHEWFDVPTKYQKRNWFHRYFKVLPTVGHLKFYDRSWYNRAVNDPVNGYCTEEEYKQFMKDVVPFEKELIEEGYIYIKFWFSIDKETQEFRFNLRKAHPIKYWKFSSNDAKAVEKFDLFTFYKEQMFVNTSTKKSPWVVVNMNDKKIGQLNAMRYILSKIPYPDKNEDIITPFKTIVYEIRPEDIGKK
jgi:polyphosphate kinase 2 (PPK2 family)